jgi:hypothetical protein
MFLLAGANANAAAGGEGWIFSPDFYYYSIKTSTGADQAESKVHLRLGYKFGPWLYGGGIYEMEKTTSNGNNTNELKGYGPSIGLVSDNFYGILHYLFNVELGVNNKYTEGTGPQVDVGYQFPLNGTFGLSPQITWRDITYKKQGGSPVSFSKTEIFPMISIFVNF